eukprot:PLAT7073.1.p2 GENE.PLAT7073.1~~PLAT7073.1.p2  ORF type:complete len:536 (-),score=273.51 PLAT7073.1:180-1697(-)
MAEESKRPGKMDVPALERKERAEGTVLTTLGGCPIDDNQNSLTAGVAGPVLISDTHLIEKLAHFDRERIPERVVHAKGAGAFGYFEVTHDISEFTKAALFDSVGKRTPVCARFSTVGGEKGSADAERDPRGFAVKFYTEEGNWDMVGNNTPVFFLRDPSKFPDFIHTQKRHPRTNLKDADMMWDFLSLVPESLHQVTILFSDRGTPKSYRHMNGYSSHTLKFVNDGGDVHWVKFHFKTDAGVECFTAEEADEWKAKDPDQATRDLFEHIEGGGEASWSVKVQLMPEAEAAGYSHNPFDLTKVWPHADYPLIDIGRFVLNENPSNYFAEVEQAAFSPSHLVPGIEASPDKMLQARLFSYPDTHRYRLGVNYLQIPVNCPYRTRVVTHARDGAGFRSYSAELSYEPNSFGVGTGVSAKAKEAPLALSGTTGRFSPADAHWEDDIYKQPGDLYRLMTAEQQERLVQNIAGALAGAKEAIRERQLKHFDAADESYGSRVRAAVAAIIAA